MQSDSLADLILCTDRLRLRPVCADDLAAIYAIHRQAEVNQYLPYQTWTSSQDARDWYAYVESRRLHNIAQHWSIIKQNSEQVIGHCLAFDHQTDQAQIEIGYVLNPNHGRRGMMREAMAELTSVLARELSLQRIVAIVETANTPSIRLLHKLGFTHIDSFKEDSGIELCLLAKAFKPDA